MKRILTLSLLMIFLTLGCEEENGPDKEEHVVLSGSGATTEFEDFQFLSMDFLGINWLVIIGTSGTDTLMISSFVGDQITEDQGIALSDTSTLIMFATIGSGDYIAANIDVGTSFVSGNLTFTDYDIDYTESDATKKIAAEFSDGASIAGGTLESEMPTFKVDISGEFEASYSFGVMALSRLPASARQKFRIER